jgi:hypothetical protein
LLKKSKQHKIEIEALNHQKIALSNELSESQKHLTNAIREHSELEGRAAPCGNMKNCIVPFWMQKRR